MYLLDIVTSINKIADYTKGLSYDKFANDSKTVDAVVRNLEIIGEAARHISPGLVVAHQDIPWMRMVGMRNKILHEYFGVDEEILWETIQQDLPELKTKIEKLLKTVS